MGVQSRAIVEKKLSEGSLPPNTAENSALNNPGYGNRGRNYLLRGVLVLCSEGMIQEHATGNVVWGVSRAGAFCAILKTKKRSNKWFMSNFGGFMERGQSFSGFVGRGQSSNDYIESEKIDRATNHPIRISSMFPQRHCRRYMPIRYCSTERGNFLEVALGICYLSSSIKQALKYCDVNLSCVVYSMAKCSKYWQSTEHANLRSFTEENPDHIHISAFHRHIAYEVASIQVSGSNLYSERMPELINYEGSLRVREPK
ncbi:hypothetical protein SMACR_01672 [Sordaria macrospora]|uniref:WGS project CABT00000000 data, contig 2.5 n=2 Tax=Sordaria macrospora TaxID=5147 RepID=F7VRI7_SORMK|nr:uncharacterized protein SMAC_01672 [Sordaria macrospora k-hell]KAA8635922.1 hypothetical protein SMACR_01672 [Sordaria macrospora]WPJ61366.1 hypothetical protein SMAC4_01672 [Sordaria macrospora]CCC08122.1 unnamed protein product [Sordaria macrospora k-hell]